MQDFKNKYPGNEGRAVRSLKGLALWTLRREVALWRDIFIKFDEDKSGEFDITEGKSLLQAVGINLNEP